MRLWIGTVISCVLAAGMVTGCGVGGDAGATTCSEFAEMSSDTGLAGALTDEQNDVLQDMLVEEDRDPSQVSMAAVQVIAYCNIYSGRASSNADQPIKNIPGLQD